SLSGGYSIIRKIVPFRGGGSRNGRSVVSALPVLLAGDDRVSHNSVTTALPGPRQKTCGAAPSMMNTDRPAALCPVTTRRTISLSGIRYQESGVRDRAFTDP